MPGRKRIVRRGKYKKRPRIRSRKVDYSGVGNSNMALSWTLYCDDDNVVEDIPCGTPGTENWTDGGTTSFGNVVCETSSPDCNQVV